MTPPREALKSAREAGVGCFVVVAFVLIGLGVLALILALADGIYEANLAPGALYLALWFYLVVIGVVLLLTGGALYWLTRRERRR